MIENYKDLIENNYCLRCAGHGFKITLLGNTICRWCRGEGKCIDTINYWPVTDNERVFNQFLSINI